MKTLFGQAHLRKNILLELTESLCLSHILTGLHPHLSFHLHLCLIWRASLKQMDILRLGHTNLASMLKVEQTIDFDHFMTTTAAELCNQAVNKKSSLDTIK